MMGLFARAAGWLGVYVEGLDSRPETIELRPVYLLFALLVGYLAIGWFSVLHEFGWEAVIKQQGGG